MMKSAEAASVGCLIVETAAAAGYARGELALPPEAWTGKLSTVVRAIYAMLDEEQVVDLVLVRDRLNAMSSGEEWLQLLEDAVDAAYQPHNYAAYLDSVRLAWLMRKTEQVADRIRVEAKEARPESEVEGFISRAASDMAGILVAREVESSNATVLSGLSTAYEDAAAFVGGDETKRRAFGLNFPFDWLTEATTGLEPGMTVIGGRPSAGKTTFEDMCVERWLSSNPEKWVLRWTMDSTREQILPRMPCRMAGVSLPRLKQGFTTDMIRNRWREAAEWVGAQRMKFYTGSELYAGIAWIRAMCARFPVQAVTIDYMQQIQIAGGGFKNDNENSRLTIVSEALKNLFNQLNMPGMVLSQLSRSIEGEGRTGGQMSDLRSSGSIEQAAEKIIFLTIPRQKRDELEQRSPGITKHKRPVLLELLKNKNGETGSFPIWMAPPYFRFYGPAEEKMVQKPNRKGELVDVWDLWGDDTLSAAELAEMGQSGPLDFSDDGGDMSETSEGAE